MVKSSDPVAFRGEVTRVSDLSVTSNLSLQQTTQVLPYSYKLSSTLPKPVVFLSKPLLGELFGAGFTKSPGGKVSHIELSDPSKPSKSQSSQHYELRFPRIAKVFRPSDRPWVDGTSLDEFQTIARTAVGRDRSGKAEDDWAKTVFIPRQPASPSVRSSQKRKEAEGVWIEKLTSADRRSGASRTPSKKARTNRVPDSRRRAADVENAENDANPEASKPDCDEEMLPVASEALPLHRRAGMSRLGSMTNLAGSPEMLPSPAAHTVTSPPSSPLFPVCPLSKTRIDSPKDTHAAPSSPLASHQASANPLVPSPEPDRTTEHQRSLQSRDEGAQPASSLPAQTPHLPTLHTFLQDAAVWLARPATSSRPSWRAPSHTVIPLGGQLHSLDALLFACGWGEAAPCSWVNRGVVFVDDADDARAYKELALSELATRRMQLLRQECTTRCKPIFVLSMALLGYDALGTSVTAEELEARAICRFG